MAVGKQSPRQKMINLMYLVLMAMLALNVSSEVMEAFSKLFDSSESTIETNIVKNKETLAELKRLSQENEAQYGVLYKKGEQVRELSEELINELTLLKTKIISSVEKDPETGKLPAADMDKSEVVDSYLFSANGASKTGKRFIETVQKYRTEMLQLVEDPTVKNQINASFDTKPTKVDGVNIPWLNYNFYGLPSIGSLAVLSSMENVVLSIENETLSSFISGRLKKATSATNLEAFVKLNKNTFSPGDNVEATVFLASKDDTKVPNEVKINGAKIDLKNSKNFVDGKVVYKFKAGAVGDRPIVGSFTFIENGKPVVVPVNGNYSVVAGSNQAIVSADKMNVVYRGLDNPITISMPGISPTKVKASASGLRKQSGSSYMLKPGTGKTVSINVSGTTDSGETIKSPPVTFRIKDVPQAMASIRGEYGSITMPKTSLAKSSVAAGLPDFVFDLDLKVLSFKVKVPGKTTVIVNGNRMNSQAQKAIASAKRGDIVTIFGIRASIIGNSSYKLKEVLPISVEISN
ncbi:type IX secretion system motor protein PorM/GldM [Wenyingzhuangia aestuarii]|uniref:type IX secretion system motor protein PorM/GldM n=1 Tax=Wenyingzhuangia aestuarii TaxID=1647582 RepID=UPI00143A7623|nr:gliding motility protein GldM [Wenyingzhuangia aestuarii]NJB81988.1 gliding motility-associated protein GldM [Wenyingzhuangia aestuarii]